MTRRFFQFSLATLLVFVAAICVVLAVRANRQHKRRVAIAKIEKLGGKVDYLQQWQPYSGGTVTWFTKQGGLKSIYVPKVGISAWLLGDDASSFVMCVEFRKEAMVTDADLTNLLPMSELRILDIGTNTITDAGLVCLESLRNLKWIRFAGDTKLTEDGIARFQEASPNCVIDK